MEILLTNDDGFASGGLWALKAELDKEGKVSVIAPSEHRSGASCSITIDGEIAVEKIERQEGAVICSLDASPVDCVKLALTQLLARKPDVLVAGINPGANTGVHVFYSGTVAAALEGAMSGVPSFSVSLEYSRSPDFGRAARIAGRLIKRLLKLSDYPSAININLPMDLAAIRGVRVTRHCTRGELETFQKSRAGNGRERFSYVLNEPLPLGMEGSDRQALSEGYVSITPLHFDLTDEVLLRKLGGQEWLQDVQHVLAPQ